MYTMEDKRSKSIEEREEEYNKARHRIFNQDVGIPFIQYNADRVAQTYHWYFCLRSLKSFNSY